MQLRPTVAADLPHVIGPPLPFRIRALTAVLEDPVLGDQVLGVGGLGYQPDGLVVAFVAMTDAARKYPTAIHRAGRAAMDMVRASGERRVVALADDRIAGARRWLERLGFEAVTVDGVDGGVTTAYVWESK